LLELLSEYAGQYYNAELKATYTFSVRDGCLFLQVNNHRHERLNPTTADEFIPHLRTPDDGRIILYAARTDTSSNCWNRWTNKVAASCL
jgi:hypothetical protein